LIDEHGALGRLLQRLTAKKQMHTNVLPDTFLQWIRLCDSGLITEVNGFDSDPQGPDREMTEL
jgi:hypothetical protein